MKCLRLPQKKYLINVLLGLRIQGEQEQKLHNTKTRKEKEQEKKQIRKYKIG